MWSDDTFLNTLRDSSDTLANTCAHDLPRDQSLAYIFTKMRADANLPPETEFPEALATFLRSIATDAFPDFARQHGGEPISIEDMLATPMAFSALVMDGFDTLRIKLGDEDADAYHFVWRVYARTMGIHPPGQPKVPRDVMEIKEVVKGTQPGLNVGSDQFRRDRLIGLPHARGTFVNLSDGGHIDNLGVYELLRRRCKVIVAADAEHNPQMSCASLATLVRYARIDLGDEAPYVKDYRRANPDFPQATADMKPGRA